MGKANKVKGELLEVQDLVELVQVLKDVADMRFHSLAQEQLLFQRFGESFAEFFRLINYSKITHPLITNDNDQLCYVVVTTEEGFVGDLNSKVINRLAVELEKNPEAKVVIVGKKGLGKAESLGVAPEKTWIELDEFDTYDLSVIIKDYLVEQILKGTFGRVALIYPWPKDLTIIKARVIKLLPCDYIVQQQDLNVENFSELIEESDPRSIIGYLADLWLSSRLYEVFQETRLAAASAQTQQLESSADKMKKESIATKLKYRKARKGDIDSSLREVFSARLVSKPN